MEIITPFHAMHLTLKLQGYTEGYKRLVAAYASSNIKVFPYQIAAAQFALSSAYKKGVILCDEGALGKSYEALLVISQMWHEGKKKILVVLPTPLLFQWIKIVDEDFSIPYEVIANDDSFNSFKEELDNPFNGEAIIITTYDYAAKKSEYIKQVKWDVTMFDEAHNLRKDTIKNTAIKEAVKDSYKLLLTATPMQNDIRDLYNLINFIDDKVFLDEDTFYNRYHKKNYSELASRVKPYCFRTTRPQVATHVKIPERIPIVASYTFSKDEKELYEKLKRYLKKPYKIAYPKMDTFKLNLRLFNSFTSSSYAIKDTLYKAMVRIKNEEQTEQVIEEIQEITEMINLADNIKENTKGSELLIALEKGFKELRKLKAKRKAVIFVTNTHTQKYLYELLENNGYKGKVLTYNGAKSRRYDILEKFKKQATILITTDIASDGLDFSFCSMVVNYDFPYNILTMEQRINRCHRQGQQTDVIVINFMNEDNLFDTRMLELINKRILQFRGIFDMSDDIIGNFGVDLKEDMADIFEGMRSKKEVEETHESVLEEHKSYNKQLVNESEETLFTTFNREVIDKISITPKYVEEETEKINDELWQITKYFFKNKSYISIDDETKTIRNSHIGKAPKLFTHSTTARMGRNEYSMNPKYRPRSGRYNLISSLAYNVLSQIEHNGVADEGTIFVKDLKEDCKIGLYRIREKLKGGFWWSKIYYIYVGKTKRGRLLSDDECKEIMELDTLDYRSDHFRYSEYGERKYKNKAEIELDKLIDTNKMREQSIIRDNESVKEEIIKVKTYTNDLYSGLEQDKMNLKLEVENLKKKKDNYKDKQDLYRIKKQITKARLNHDKYLSQEYYKKKNEIEQALHKKIENLNDEEKYEYEITRIFAINAEGLEKEKVNELKEKLRIKKAEEKEQKRVRAEESKKQFEQWQKEWEESARNR